MWQLETARLAWAAVRAWWRRRATWVPDGLPPGLEAPTRDELQAGYEALLTPVANRIAVELTLQVRMTELRLRALVERRLAQMEARLIETFKERIRALMPGANAPAIPATGQPPLPAVEADCGHLSAQRVTDKHGVTRCAECHAIKYPPIGPRSED